MMFYTNKALEKCKNFYRDHDEEINKGLKLVERVTSDISDVLSAQKLSVFSWIKVGFKANGYFKDLVLNKDDYFQNNKWKPINDTCITNFLIDLVQSDKSFNVTNINSSRPKDLNIAKLNSGENSFKFGWEKAQYYEAVGYIDGDLSFFINRFKEFQWNKGKILKLEYSSGGGSNNPVKYVLKNVDSSDYFNSRRCENFYQKILSYKNNGLGRSIIFYGPPGTGKSNILKYIAAKLQGNTLILEDLAKIKSQELSRMMEILNPNCIIMEDIDHLYNQSNPELLENLEKMNKRNSIILATANVINSLNSAMIRPGRFDELIEISYGDEDLVKEMLDCKLQIFDEVKTMPLAFIDEVSKRAKVIGNQINQEDIKDISARAARYAGSTYKL